MLHTLTHSLTDTHTHTHSEGLIQGVKDFIDTLVRRVFGNSVVGVIAL